MSANIMLYFISCYIVGVSTSWTEGNQQQESASFVECW